MMNRPWTVYILKCADETLYTGVTNDLESRLEKHANGRGAKYTRSRGPYTVLFSEEHPTKNSALKREFEIKLFTRQEKLLLANISGGGPG